MRLHPRRQSSSGADSKRYPPYVITTEQRRRWDLAEGIARGIFGDVHEASVWMAARSIYAGKTPTTT